MNGTKSCMHAWSTWNNCHIVKAGGCARNKGDAGGSVADVVHCLLDQGPVPPRKYYVTNCSQTLQPKSPWECPVELVLNHTTGPEEIGVCKVSLGERSVCMGCRTDQDVALKNANCRFQQKMPPSKVATIDGNSPLSSSWQNTFVQPYPIPNVQKTNALFFFSEEE